MFGNADLIKKVPKIQDFIWVGEYYDGTHLAEFNNNLQENSFYDIKKDKLIRFGLVGHGIAMYFETSGIFKIAGRMIEILYRVDDKIYPLTGRINTVYNDIITYKDAHQDYNASKELVFKPLVDCYNFGYKAKIAADEVKFNFKPIVVIPLNKPVHLKIHLVANKDLDGSILIKKNGKIIEELKSPIKENVGGELAWIIR